MAAPEGGKAAGRRAVRLCDLPRLAHEPAVEAQGLNAALAQARLDAGVERDRRRLVAPGPENAASVRRSGEREDDLVGLAAHDVEARAARREALLHRLQRLGEAPFRRPAERAAVARRVVVHIDMERRTIRGGENRRLVVETEVVAQPDDVRAYAQPAPSPLESHADRVRRFGVFPFERDDLAVLDRQRQAAVFELERPVAEQVCAASR